MSAVGLRTRGQAVRRVWQPLRRAGRWWLQRDHPPAIPARADWPLGLRRVRQAGFAVLGAEFLVLCWWSHVLTTRYALTWDFSTFQQAAYLIAHGVVDPYSTSLGHAFWQDHGAFIMWPLAVLELVWPHPETLSWAQNAASVGACAVAFAWICDLAAVHWERKRDTTVAIAIATAGLVMLVANPWLPWADSYDVHIEAYDTLFTMLLARNAWLGRRRAYLWILPALASGDVAATYLAALGISLLLLGRRYWRQGTAIAVAGAVWLIILSRIHGTLGTPFGEYAAVLGRTHGSLRAAPSATTLALSVILHPLRVATVLYSNRLNLWGNVSPTGVLGLLWPPMFGPSLVTLLEGGLTHGGANFSPPGFQNVALLPFGAVGAIAIVVALARTRIAQGTRSTLGLLALLAANAVGWGIVWLPQLSTTWLRVSPAAAAVLHEVSRQIGPADEVIASQGVAGGFAGRRFQYPLMGGAITAPVKARHVWFVFAPDQGIELAPLTGTYQDIAFLERMPGVRLVVASSGIWAFEWTPSPGVKALHLNGTTLGAVAGADVTGAGGEIVREGAPARWYAASDGRPGYVVDRAYWEVASGAYRVRLALSVGSSATVEVRNATTSQLLSRMQLPATQGRTVLGTEVRVARYTPPPIFSGWGIWRDAPTVPATDRLEVRVWDPGGADQVNVYSIAVTAAGRSRR